MAANFDNLALRPEFVPHGLRLSAAQLVKVDEAHDEGSVLGKIQKDLDIEGKRYHAEVGFETT